MSGQNVRKFHSGLQCPTVDFSNYPIQNYEEMNISMSRNEHRTRYVKTVATVNVRNMENACMHPSLPVEIVLQYTE